MNYRELMNENILRILRDKDFIHTVWEGGAAATGFLDKYSDLDLMVISDDDKVEEVFSLMAEFLESNHGIKQKFRVPEPSWHGMSQCYYLLKDSPEFYFVDMAVQKLSAKERFMEQDRHGIAKVWFDKKNLIDNTPTPEEEIFRKCKKSFQQITSSFFLIPLDIKKQVKRGRFIDALESYFRGAIGRFALLLNLTYRPAKFDFNLRYSYRDFPQRVNDKLQPLMLIKDETDLLTKLDSLEEWFYQLEAQLKDRYSS